MAVAFKNARMLLTTTYATGYTVPAATTAIIIGCQIANVDGVNSATASIQWLDSSASNAATRLMDLGAVPPGYAVEAIAHKLVLATGDAFQGKASADLDLELTLSIMEIT